jgi:hypothetical protein
MTIKILIDSKVTTGDVPPPPPSHFFFIDRNRHLSLHQRFITSLLLCFHPFIQGNKLERNNTMTMTEETSTNVDAKSALQDNIDRMGKNAYYFAHAHKVKCCTRTRLTQLNHYHLSHLPSMHSFARPPVPNGMAKSNHVS